MSTLPGMTVLPDAAAFRAWLAGHHDSASEVWLVIAKKGTTDPTSLTYVQALEEALCYGWIDGQARSRDQATYLQRFSPRRRHSSWSRPNVARVERLRREGRMRPAGLAAVENAKAGGRWPESAPAPNAAPQDKDGARSP
jgi:uncharacterized protein YdeI (YjbR/CyaY-like superfamily)